jgi:DNA-binding transcriptional MocR family regulator
MSKNYVKAVLDYLPLTDPTDTSVLVALSEYASDETRLAWPSIAALSRRTRLDRRTVQRSLRSLESRSLISTTLGGQDDQGRNVASCYRLEFDHHGLPLEKNQKAPPKRALRPAPAPRPEFVPTLAVTSAKLTPHVAVPMPRSMKKVPAPELERDLHEERQRQLAALRDKSTL